ncbi:MAG: alpha/beta hydrolase [Clostridia bacterium]|nr:alpha/beta hydrolase [Clostridia bacterium]
MRYSELIVSAEKEEGKLYCYEHTESPEMPVSSRRAMLVIPGGAYAMCSDREGEPIAVEFFNRGYNAYVIQYPCAPKRFPAQLAVAAAAMDTIRKRASLCKTDPKKVFAVGFSAGGHLCGTIANCPPDFYAVKQYDFKPNGVVLAYPVIGGTPTHGGSFDNLLGTPRPEGTEWLDLHTSVRPDNPPAFIWATADDGAVPACNSLKYAMAYADAGLTYELHIYESGPHGLSLADDRVSQFNPQAGNNPVVAQWVTLADKFLRKI